MQNRQQNVLKDENDAITSNKVSFQTFSHKWGLYIYIYVEKPKREGVKENDKNKHTNVYV